MASLESIDHIAIEVKDISAAVSWYCDRFSCEIVYQDKSWAMLKFANINLAFVLPGQHPSHIAFKKKNAETFGKLASHRDDSRSVYISDTQGNTVEILKDK
jgi:catechol-2,3-dioxygenase